MNGINTIVALVILLLFSAFFSASETAFTSASKPKLSVLEDKKNKRASLALKLMDKYEKLLTTILIGNNIVNIAATSIVTAFFISYFKNEEIGTTYATVAVTLLVLIFGEITPKNIAKQYSEKLSVLFSPFMFFLMWVLTPVSFLFTLWNKFVSHIIGDNEDRKVTDEELLNIVEEACEDGGIGEEQSELIRSAIEFQDQEAVDILTPRVELTGAPSDITLGELNELFHKTGFSRIPVYVETIDNIIGIVHQKDVCYLDEQKKFNIKEHIKKPVFASANTKISVLLKTLQKEKSHLAVITDEYGGTLGVVSLEDILEELVGEIWDEYDDVVNEITKINDETYKILGSTSLDKVSHELDIDFDESSIDSSTVNGWVIEMLGMIPSSGAETTIGDWRVQVLGATGKKIDEVIFMYEPKETETQEEE